MQSLDDEAPKAKTAQFKAALKSGAKPEDILPEAFRLTMRTHPSGCGRLRPDELPRRAVSRPGLIPIGYMSRRTTPVKQQRAHNDPPSAGRLCL